MKTSLKYKNILCEYFGRLVDRLELLIGRISIESRNTSDELLYEGISILDVLLQNGKITEYQHERIYGKYFP